MQRRVTIGRGLRRGVGGDNAVASRPVFYHERLTRMLDSPGVMARATTSLVPPGGYQPGSELGGTDTPAQART